MMCAFSLSGMHDASSADSCHIIANFEVQSDASSYIPVALAAFSLHKSIQKNKPTTDVRLLVRNILRSICAVSGSFFFLTVKGIL